MSGEISTQTTVKWYQVLIDRQYGWSCCSEEFDTDTWEYWNSNYNPAVKSGDCDFDSPCSIDLARQEEKILDFIDKNLSGSVAVAFHDQYVSDSHYIGAPSYMCNIYIFENEKLMAQGKGIEVTDDVPGKRELPFIHELLSNCYARAVDNLGDPISPFDSPSKYEQYLGRYDQPLSRKIPGPVPAFYHSAVEYTEDIVDLSPWSARY